MPQLELRSITKTYETDGDSLRAVADVSLDVEAGEFVSIVGHSGSGKTTLLSLIGGIVRPSSGRILFEGKDLAGLSSDRIAEYRAVKIGFMFQFASLLPVLTVKENLLLPVVFGPHAGWSKEKKAEELLAMVGLADKSSAYPSQLSGGQQRRVAIARAFMNEPALILADEPTGDLDEETEMDMMRFFQSMNKNAKTTFIMVTHNTDLARLTQRRLRMHRGSLESENSSGR
jgi:putative ABC transport system ATP-binding protein/lipoprotein-releasing system ATP-binding protein